MNIYVGNLAFSVTEEDLKKAFEAFGQVASANVIKDQYSNQSKGFGFVEMPETSEAQAAIAALNGKELNGRAINVNEARPKTDRNRGRIRGRRRTRRRIRRRRSGTLLSPKTGNKIPSLTRNAKPRRKVDRYKKTSKRRA